MKQKVVLLYPPDRIHKNTSKYHLQPIGVVQIASYLKEKGVDVSIIDAQLHRMGMREILDKILQKKPSIVGISTTSNVVLIVLEIAGRIKEIDSSIKVVLGGPHINSTRDEIFSYTKDVDCLVYGEGEETFFELVNNFGEEIEGVIYPDREFKPRKPKENLDELPFMDYNLIDDYKPYKIFYAPDKTIASMVVTRGYPFSCTFCNAFVTAGRKQRRMSPKRVIDEIKHLQENWNINYVCFKDSTFTLSREWIEELCDLMLMEKLNIGWRCNTRVNLVDKELLKKMKKAGCACISYGVESGSQRVLDRIKKGTKLDEIKNAFELTKEAKIELHSSYMFGNPEETLDEAHQTIDLAKELDPDYAVFNATGCFPGTELYNEMVKKGKLKNPKWYMDSKGESGEEKLLIAADEGSQIKVSFDQNKVIKEAYRSFYFRPSFIIKNIIKTIKKPSLIHSILEALPQVFR